MDQALPERRTDHESPAGQSGESGLQVRGRCFMVGPEPNLSPAEINMCAAEWLETPRSAFSGTPTEPITNVFIK